MRGVPNVFSRRTLGEFEDASASIPLRQIDRIFNGADVRPGDDPGGPEGARRTQFRRYLAGVDQHDSQQMDRLGHALGALVKEVAASKQEFLVKAAERDGFFLVDGAFRPAETTPRSFAVTRVEDLAFIEDRGRRLRLLAHDRPADATRGAKELAESVCRTVLRLIGEPGLDKAGLVDIADSTLAALGLGPANVGGANESAQIVRHCLQRLYAIVADLAKLQDARSSGRRRDGEWNCLSPRHARLAIGAAVTFGCFVAETHAERAASNKARNTAER